MVFPLSLDPTRDARGEDQLGHAILGALEHVLLVIGELEALEGHLEDGLVGLGLLGNVVWHEDLAIEPRPIGLGGLVVRPLAHLVVSFFGQPRRDASPCQGREGPRLAALVMNLLGLLGLLRLLGLLGE